MKISISFILFSYFYILCNGEADDTFPTGLDSFKLNPLNESLITTCCDRGSDYANRARNKLDVNFCTSGTTALGETLDEVCTSVFASCCQDALKTRACQYGQDLAMEQVPFKRRLWRFQSLADVKEIVDYCKPSESNSVVGELMDKTEKCCLCRQVERQVVTEESVQIRRILWRFCKKVGCCMEYRMRDLLKRLVNIRHYNRPARDAAPDADIIRTDKSIKCQDQFIWDQSEGICVKMVIKCPIGMKMDPDTHKCIPRTEEDLKCDDGYEFNEEMDKCVDIDECKRYKLSDLCSAAGSDCTNTEGSYKCECAKGFQKINNESCHDIDECKLGLHNCTVGQACMNTIGHFRCLRKVPCGYGYTLNENTQECEDIDECVSFKNACRENMDCKNVRGSYHCIMRKCPSNMKRDAKGECTECEAGFRFLNATKECIDIDECVENLSKCKRNEYCINEPGRYDCKPKMSCPSGTQLNEDGTECLDLDECLDNSFDCEKHEICENTHGSYVCVATPCTKENMIFNYQKKRCICKPGFEFKYGVCVDVNECEDDAKKSLCPTGHTCQNTLGGFQCISDSECDLGFQRLSMQDNCTDIDECLTQTHNCGLNMVCVNKIGSHDCECAKGYVKNTPNSCEDINECAIHGNRVLCPDERSKCINTAGSYECICPDGLSYHGNPINRCQDIDECAINSNICGKYHKCVNLSGNYLCDCAPGFRQGENNRVCVDIDECVEGKLGSNSSAVSPCSSGVCVNTPGSFECRCPSGFKLDSSGNCQDINECEETIGACPNQPQPTCINLQGSYRCVAGSCPGDYVKQKFINGFRCELPSNRMCSSGDTNCIQKYPIHVDKIYFELKSNLRVPQILRRITPMKLRPGDVTKVELREHYAFDYEKKAPVDVKESFKLQMSITQKGRIELVLVKAIPRAVDILISVYIKANDMVLTDTRLYMFVTDSLKDRIIGQNSRTYARSRQNLFTHRYGRRRL